MKTVAGTLLIAQKCLEDLGSGKGGWAWEEVVVEVAAAAAFQGHHDECILCVAGALDGHGSCEEGRRLWEEYQATK